VKDRRGDQLRAFELWAMRDDARLTIVYLSGEIFRVAGATELVPTAHAECVRRFVVADAAFEGLPRS
jgi:hypothetical protein